MAVFRYRALTPAGELTVGELDGANRAAVIERLQELGYLPVEAEDRGARAPVDWRAVELFAGDRLALKDVSQMTQELATLLGAGLPLDQALAIMVELAESKRQRKFLAAALDKLRGGAGLADALAAAGPGFSAFHLGMIRAGEAGGSLDVVLARLAEYLARALALRDTVRSALIYPAILLAMAGLSILLVLTVVLPQFRPLFAEAGAALPLSTQILLMVGDAVERWWWALLIAAGAAALGLRRLLRSAGFAPYWHGFVLRLPVAREVVAKAETARFARGLGTLIGSGLPLSSALPIIRDTIGNTVIARAVEKVTARLKEGEGLSRPLARAGVFPRVAIHLMRVGEETGRLEEMLIKTADLFDREVKRGVDRLVSLLVPTLTIGLGLIIGAVVMSVFTAILSINNLAV